MDIVNKLEKALNTNADIELFEVEIEKKKKAIDYKHNNDNTIFNKMVQLLQDITDNVPKVLAQELEEVNSMLNACMYEGKKNKDNKNKNQKNHTGLTKF